MPSSQANPGLDRLELIPSVAKHTDRNRNIATQEAKSKLQRDHTWQHREINQARGVQGASLGLPNFCRKKRGQRWSGVKQ